MQGVHERIPGAVREVPRVRYYKTQYTSRTAEGAALLREGWGVHPPVGPVECGVSVHARAVKRPGA